jgi:hypothetical protein
VTHPPHWWLGVPRIGAPRAERDWVVYVLCAGAVLLGGLALMSRGHATTARADVPVAHPREVRVEAGAAHDRALGGRAAPLATADGGRPHVGMQLPAVRRGGVAAPPPGAQFLATLDHLGAVTGNREITGGLLGNEAGEMGGGFGFGTELQMKIDVPDEGPKTELHVPGYGIGSGRCGCMHQRRARVPEVSIGEVDVPPDYRAVVRRYVRRNLDKITYCYEKELLGAPGLAGTVETHFTIERHGTVAAITASGVDEDVSTCIADVIARIAFPRMEVPVEVRYPFALQLR